MKSVTLPLVRPLATRSLLCVAALVAIHESASRALAAEDAKSPDAAKKVTYEEHVKPILRDNCFLCHNQEEAENDLALDSFARAMQGGAGGAAIVPGDPGASRLWKLVSHEESPGMPPEDDKLPDEVLATIRAWIAGGALENSSSKPPPPKKPSMQIATASTSTKPAGPPAMPEGLSRQPVMHTPRGMAVTTLAASPWAPLVAIAGHHQILLYHTETAELLAVLPYPDEIAHVLRFSRNGELLLAGGGHAAKSGGVKLFDVKTGRNVLEVGDELDAALAADVIEDHSLIALGGPQKIVRIFATNDAAQPLHEIRKHTEWIYAVEFSPDGVLLATADRNGGLFVWETETAREYLDLRGHGSAVTAVSWRLDSNVLASAGEDGSVRLWEMNKGGQIKNWTAHGGGTLSVQFTHDGRLITAGRDRTVRIWDGEGNQVQAFEPFGDLALEAVLTHDGSRAVGGDWNGEIRMWNVADAALAAALPMNPPTLEMAAHATALDAVRAQEQLDGAQAEFDAATRGLEGLFASISETANQITAAQADLEKSTAESNAAQGASTERMAAFNKAQEALAAAQAALEVAQAELATAQKDAETKAAAVQSASQRVASHQTAAEKLAADKTAAEQSLAEKKAALDAAAQNSASAYQEAGKAAAEKAAYEESQTAQAKSS